MKNKLLITTALVALTCGHNAYADVTINTDTVLENAYTDNVVISGGNVTTKDSSTVSLNYPDGKNLTVNGGNLSLNDSTIYTFNGNTEISGDAVLNLNNDSDINTNKLTISGGTINLNKGELRQNNSFKMTGGTINMNAENGEVHIGSLGRDTEKVAGTVTSYAGGTTDISGGVINVNGGVGLGSSANDIYDNGNVIFGKSINVKDGAVINIKQGATLFAYENFQIDEPDLDNSDLDIVTFGNKGTIIMSADPSKGSTPVINLGGTLSANINGDDRGKIHLQNSNAKIDGKVEDVSLIFEDSHTLSEAVTGTIGGLDIFEIQKGTLTYDKEIDGGASSVVVGEGATLDIGDNELHSGGEKEVAGEGVHFKDNSTLKFTVTDKDTYGKIYANYVNISENGTTLDMSLNSAALSAGDEPLTLKLFNDEDTPVEIEGKFANLTSNSRYDFADNGDGTYTVTANGTTASDIVADDISAVSGIPAGTFNVHAKLGEFKSAESFPITFFSGFIAEAEEIYDSPTVIGAPEGYNVNAKPEDVMNYTRIEDVTGKNWEQPISGTFRGQSYSNAPAYQIGAANCMRPSDETTLENSSNGMYLGELSRITTFSVHFYSDVEREVNIIMHAASAMLTGSVVADIKINKMFDIYIGQDAMNEDGTFDQSTKLEMDESVVLDGGDYTGTGMNLDQMTTAWKSVNLGRMQLKKGDNVIYFNNIFDSSDPEFSSVKNKWMMNIDCFEVEFV